MWAQACEMIAQAERMHRKFFRLHASPGEPLWEPPADVFENEQEILIVVAMPGVVAERVEITTEPGALVVRAERPLPFAGSRHAVKHLEIPYGFFERRIPLNDAQYELASREMTHGCLVLHLRKAS